MAEKLFIGLDIGTTAVKAAAFCANGAQVAQARQDVTVERSNDGWSELSMDTVWDAARDCLVNVVAQVDPNAVHSIGVCGQGDGLWMLDRDHRPVRNAILWNDARATAYVQVWTDDGTSDEISRYSRTAIWPGASGAALRWVYDNEREAFEKVAHILCAKDWIVYKLTGNIGTDFSDATIPFMDLETKTYASQVFRALGLPDMTRKLPNPDYSTALAGTLSEDIGLPEIPVARGSSDVTAMMTGLGVAEPGDMCLILGTTAVLTYVTEPELFTKPPLAATLHHPFNSNWIRGLAPQSGASAFDWFAALHPNSFGGEDAADIAAKINAAAQDVPPGANGVLFLPFLTGERAPFVAPDAAASFHGMRASTTKADLACAVMEGTALSLLHCLKASGANAPKRVVLTGGGARNALWCQIVADILGVTILANAAEDHGLWGAAQYGAAAAGAMEPLSVERDEAFDEFDPNAETRATYTALYETYLKAVEASRAIWAAMGTQK
ncbi:MAG: FGGY family carbohydrate kinase [Paracoccaceae bacterium]